MGFKKQTTIYELKFEDPKLEGLEISVKALSTGKFMKLMKLMTAIDESGRSQLDGIDQLFAGFADALVSWNLEDEDGTPVPATLEGIQDQELDFNMDLIKSWMGAVSGVSSDLGKDSPSGETSLEQSLPMAPLSTSPGS